jgi:hypothetical protein
MKRVPARLRSDALTDTVSACFTFASVLFSFSFGLRSPGNSRGRRFYFNYQHTAVGTLDKIVPKELAENSAVVAVTAYALANMEPRTLSGLPR